MNYSLKGVKVGDKLVMVEWLRYARQERVTNVTVTRVGRKYLYVADDRGYKVHSQFRIEDGGEHNAYTARLTLYTPEANELRKEREYLMDRLREMGLSLGTNIRLWTNDDLSELVKLAMRVLSAGDEGGR